MVRVVLAYLFLEAGNEGSVQYTGCLNGKECDGAIEEENGGNEDSTRLGPVQRVIRRLAWDREAQDVPIRGNEEHAARKIHGLMLRAAACRCCLSQASLVKLNIVKFILPLVENSLACSHFCHFFDVLHLVYRSRIEPALICMISLSAGGG